MGLFKSIKGLVDDAVDIVSAPVEIAVDLTRGVTKPVAEVAREAVRDVKELTDQDEPENEG